MHLVIPGRTQSGPVAIAGKTYHETIPAAAWFLRQLVVPEEACASGSSSSDVPPSIGGRVQRNVKDANDVTVEGKWLLKPASMDTDAISQRPLHPYWLFQSRENIWHVMSCDLDEHATTTAATDDAPSDAPLNNTPTVLELLKTCLDNFSFRLGSSGIQGIDIFFHQLKVGDCFR